MIPGLLPTSDGEGYMDTVTGKVTKFEQELRATDSVAIFSGGLDSTTLVYNMLDKGMTPHLLSFNYGQRHRKELDYARHTAKKLNLPHDVIDLRGITHLISNSALTTQQPMGYNLHGGSNPKPFEYQANHEFIEVPEGHYAEENMKLTVVPNRNMIMLSIAVGIAVNAKATCVATGVHAGDHEIYPDCRPMFISAMDLAILQGNEGFHNFSQGGKQAKKPEGFGDTELRREGEQRMFGNIEATDDPLLLGGPLYTPFLHWSKADIAYQALLLGVPTHETWSCYKGGDKHCGRCGTCVERLEAIHEAYQRWYDVDKDDEENFYDLTEYEDDQYWKTQVGIQDAE